MLTQKNYENEIFDFQISTCDTLLEINIIETCVNDGTRNGGG